MNIPMPLYCMKCGQIVWTPPAAREAQRSDTFTILSAHGKCIKCETPWYWTGQSWNGDALERIRCSSRTATARDVGHA